MLGHQISPEQAAGLSHSFVIGGENLTSDQIEFWQKNAPETLLFNEYGPTETVVGCAVFEAHDWQGAGSVPFGRSITNTTVYVLDKNFRPKDWVLALDAKKGEQAMEWGIEPGEDLTYDYYYKMNEHQFDVAMAHLKRLAKEDEPFFLNYWPQYPIDFSRPDDLEETDNGGSWVARMQELDSWIGELLEEVEN